MMASPLSELYASTPVEYGPFHPVSEDECPSVHNCPYYEELVTGFQPPTCFLYFDKQPPNKELVRQVFHLQEKFSSLMTLVPKELQSQKVSPGDVNTYLTTLFMARKENTTQSTLQELHGDFKHEEVITHFSHIGAWDFLNFLLLSALVRNFKCSGLQEKLRDYATTISEFKKATKLTDFLRVWCGRSSQAQEMEGQGRVLIAKVEGMWPEYTLADVSDIEGYMEDEFRIKQLVLNLRLRNGRSGCVRLMWIIPPTAANSIKEALFKNQPDLSKRGITELVIDGKLFYKASSSPWRSADYASLYKWSMEQPDQFWAKMAANYLQWEEMFQQVSDCDMKTGVIRWFTGGKLNVAVNCLDRHVDEDPDRIALIWEKDEPEEEKLTYRELLKMTCQVANVLKSHSVKKGDVVIIYLHACPLAVAAMLACARIGAVHSVVFTQINSKDLHTRIKSANAKVVITAVNGKLAGKDLHLKNNVDKAVVDTNVQTVLVCGERQPESTWCEQDVNLEEEMNRANDWCPAELMDSEDKLFIMYTSGTSDPQPTGIVHTQAGYLLYVALTHKFVFDYHPGEVFACDADLGWITGHSYVVYGPLCNGGTTVLFGSKATYPDPGRYWEMVERLKVNHFYTTPAILEKLMKEDKHYVQDRQLSTLRNLGSVGQPLCTSVWKWYHSAVGKERCPILDTWWQTEIGGIALILDPPHESASSAVPSRFPPGPFFGVNPSIEDKGADVPEGKLYLKKPLPAMARGIVGEKGLKEQYFSSPSGFYTSDIAQRSKMGGYRIISRENDAIVNKCGQLLEIPEIEDQMGQSDHRINGATLLGCDAQQGINVAMLESADKYLNDDERNEVARKVRKAVEKKFGSDAVPDVVRFVEQNQMPRTFNGKVVKYVLRKNAHSCMQDELLGDTTTKDATYLEMIREISPEPINVQKFW